MSVVTTADENLRVVIESVDIAVKHLSKIVIERCWGYKDFSKDYIEALHNAMNDLIEIRNTLDC